jgi:hypothetical protein
MSASASPRSAALPPPTRQQLDELDALLQRMLAIPVRPVEEPAPAPNEATAAPKSYSTSEPEPVLEQRTESMPSCPAPGSEGEDADSEGWVPFRSSWQPSALTWQPLKESWNEVQAALRQRGGDDAQPATPASNDAAGAAPPAQAESTSKESVFPTSNTAAGPTTAEEKLEPEPVSWASLPLVAFNGLFDLLLLPLGPVGKWLRGRGGRILLGTLGVLALLAAGALAVADWIGWTW